MKKSVSMLVSAALLIVGLVACPSDKTEVTPPAVTPPATPPPVDVVTTELILNGGFEAETSDWNFDGTDRSTLSKTCVKTGTYYGLITLPNLGVEYNPLLSQNFNVPAQGTTLLTFWVRIESNEPTNRDVILIVKANAAILTTLTMKNSR